MGTKKKSEIWMDHANKRTQNDPKFVGGFVHALKVMFYSALGVRW